MTLFAHSYSPLTIYDLRCSIPREHESNQQHFARLCATYALSKIEARLLIETPQLDVYGRGLGD